MALTSTDLVVIPCSDSKRGTGRTHPDIELVQLFGEKSAALLRDGRKIALQNRHDADSEPTPLLDLYTGFLYSMPGFRRYVSRLLRKDVHFLIVTGGYGLAHPYERGQRYNVKIRSTASIWKRRFPKILARYIKRNGIKRVFVACSAEYAKVLATGLRVWATNVEVYWFVPRYDGQGNRYSSLAHQIGKAVFGLSRPGEPDHRWKRTPPAH